MNHPLKDALPIVAAAYGRKFGVAVKVEGAEAYTDGRQIVIPATDMDDDQYHKIVWGYLAHEAAHIRHTDFDVVAKTSAQPLRKALLNILEDVRIEERIACDYPGTRRTIETVLAYLVDQGGIALPQQPQPVQVLQHWLLCYLRSRLLKQSVLESLCRKSSEQLKQVLDEQTIRQLTALVDQVLRLETTAEVLEVVDEILGLLESVANELSTETEDTTASSAETQSEESAAESTGPAPFPLLAQQILASSVSDQLDDLFEQVSDELEGQVHEGQKKGATLLNLPKPEQAKRGSSDLLKQTVRTSAHLRAQLQGLVQAKQEGRVHPKRRGRGIDLKRLARSQTGESRLFIKSQNRVAPNTAVHLLVDISGSMSKAIVDTGQRNYQVANQAALALALALEGIPGVVPAVSYFPGHQSDVVEVLRAGQSARKRAAYFDQSPRGCTPMGQAIWYAANELLQQKQPRKLLIVITDGAPDDEASTKGVVARCRCSGFDLLGVGVQTTSVEQLFPENVVIREVFELRQRLFSIIDKHICIRNSAS